MKRRRFLEVAGAAGAWAAAGGLGALVASCGDGRVKRRAAARPVIVLGVGGMDAAFVGRLMAEGKLPRLAALARQGTFATLRTTTPAEAETAWATFATGMAPGRHGIFGRFGRDAETYRPLVADVAYEPGRYLGNWRVLPGRYRSHLVGEPFWRYAAARGIATAALWAPADFPPDAVDGSFFLAGAGVPDASLGAYNYHFFASDPGFPERETDAGGIWRKIEMRGGVGRVSLEPPAALGGEPLELTFEPDTPRDLSISAAGRTQCVRKGTYSPYFELPFGGGRVLGRFFVGASSPHVRVWLAPLEIDPRAPLVDVAAPRSFGEDLAADGPFGTRGKPLDVAALHDRVIGPGPLVGEYCLQTEEKRQLGLWTRQRLAPDLFLLFDYGLNALAHVFWRYHDPGHPAFESERFFSYADALQGAYRYVDETLAKFLASPGAEDAAVFVVSAHGNRSFRRAFDPSRWLWENGYLRLAPGARPFGVGGPAPEAALRRGRYRPAVAWDETRAYAQGYGQIYLNVKGRERRGVVPPSEVEALKAELRERLLAVRDGGLRPVAAVDDGAELFAGPRRHCAPDLVVSLADGYRVSWESILGGFAEATFADNRDVWSGDHASVDAGAVPGVLFSNLKLEVEDAALEDVGPTILKTLGLDEMPHADGRPLAEKRR
ncbi:MAG TPA: alkaline phosphatase family protein [bacterium]|nr:alkaline phosphatase family protein [bacterium]